MSFKIEKENQYTLIKVLSEKLDSNIAPSLKSELVMLNEKENKFIIMDLTDCRYCDSSGLSSILVANRICKNVKGKLIIFGLQPSVKKLISISQLDTILNIMDTKEEAIGNIQKISP